MEEGRGSQRLPVQVTVISACMPAR
jgi:hypothetical protein